MIAEIDGAIFGDGRAVDAKTAARTTRPAPRRTSPTTPVEEARRSTA